VKFINKINHPESASILIGISPVMTVPEKTNSNFSPNKAGKAIYPLNIALLITAESVSIPFYFTFKNGITSSDSIKIAI